MTDQEYSYLIQTMASQIKDIQSTLNRLDKILTGDDDPSKGLFVQFTRLDQSVKNCQAERAKEDNKRLVGMRIMIASAALVSSIATTIISFILRSK